MAHRLLIAAGQSVSSSNQLPFGIRGLIDAADEILVITPTLPTRFEWLASATDRAQEQADERLQTVLGQLADLGSEAVGAVGADDPLLAFEDAIRQFAPDHLLIALRRGSVRMAGARAARPDPTAIQIADDSLLGRFGLTRSVRRPSRHRLSLQPIGCGAWDRRTELWLDCWGVAGYVGSVARGEQSRLPAERGNYSGEAPLFATVRPASAARTGRRAPRRGWTRRGHGNGSQRGDPREGVCRHAVRHPMNFTALANPVPSGSCSAICR